MTIGPLRRRLIARALVLVDEEGAARELGRELELAPGNREEATAAFRRADELRDARLALLRRCGLL